MGPETEFDDFVEHASVTRQGRRVGLVDRVEMAADEFPDPQIAQVVSFRSGEFGERLFGISSCSADCALTPLRSPVGRAAIGDCELPGAAVQFGHRAGAAVDPDAGREGPVGELPGGALHGSQLAVDSHHSGSACVRGTGPHVVTAAALDLCLEAFLGARHTGSLLKVYRCTPTRSVTRLSRRLRPHLEGESACQTWCAPWDSNPEPAD